jgi:hypothetical protein
MGHNLVFLTVDRIAFGVDRLLEFVTDRAAAESSRPPSPPCGGRAIRTVAAKQFDDGTTFQLDICSRLPPTSAASVDPVIRELLAKLTAPPLNILSKMKDLEIDMVWYFAEPIPQELLFPSGDGTNPELDTFLQDAQSWVLRVSVCGVCYPWINPKGYPELRKVRSVLDSYALPRLILPESDATNFREDFIALIALFAAKAQCLWHKDDQLPEFFRSYCDRFFAHERERRKLSDAEWYGVVDVVFRRLYSGIAGMGFTMPVLAPSFRSYVAKAIRCQAASAAAASAAPERLQIPKPGRFPMSIKEAAANLGVSHMTVRRWMSRLHFHEWTEETWMAVSAKIIPKKQWQELTGRLQNSGLEKEAARKRVQRCKRSGLTLNEARRRNSPKCRKGTCTACGEEQALGELFEGEFYCSTCYAEKTGFSPEG